MRALAAIWIVLFHFRGSFESLAPWLAIADPVWQAGYLGVDLFFPLSGFVLAYNYADRLSSWSWHGAMAFWQNRIARVWPVHIATLHIDLVMSLVTGRMGTGLPRDSACSSPPGCCTSPSSGRVGTCCAPAGADRRLGGRLARW